MGAEPWAAPEPVLSLCRSWGCEASWQRGLAEQSQSLGLGLVGRPRSSTCHTYPTATSQATSEEAPSSVAGLRALSAVWTSFSPGQHSVLWFLFVCGNMLGAPVFIHCWGWEFPHMMIRISSFIFTDQMDLVYFWNVVLHTHTHTHTISTFVLFFLHFL